VSLVVDAEHLGTSESSWIGSGRLEALAPLPPITSSRVIVVAPHPDDEVLGAGGLIQLLSRCGLTVEILSVTDGEGSHPQSATPVAQHLRAVRSEETRQALTRLGLPELEVSRLGIPDGHVGRHEALLVDSLADRLNPGDLCVAPWIGDGHPDHDACGRAAHESAAAMGASLLGCLIWAWHWARPEGKDLPWDQCRRVDLTSEQTARKRWATSSYRSQIRPIGPAEEDRAVLLPPMLRRYWRPFEIFVDDRSNDG
jgi:LmbE family N-acetylglucosaminyl deacetylase